MRTPQRPPTPSSGSPSPTDLRERIRQQALPAHREVTARLQTIQRLAADGASTAQPSAISEEAEAATHTLDALDALLAFDGGALQLEPLEISDLLIAALSRWKTRAPRHTFELALPGHEPALLGDSDRIAHALDALIAWAVACSAGGDVRVGLRYAAAPGAEPGEPNAEEAMVSVRALLREGVAAPREFADPEAEADATHDGATLALAHAVATAHGGRMWASPGPDPRMLTIGLALPSTPLLEVPSDAAIAGPDSAMSAGEDWPGTATGPSLPLVRPRRVALVAHSDARLARYLRANLERDGYRALVASDLAATLRLIDAEEPDIVLLDAILDARPPLEPLQRALGRTSAPVLLLTHAADPALAARALDAGAADVISMPLSVEETLARVRRALRTAPHTAHASQAAITVCGDLVINEAERRVTLAGASVSLSRTEYRLLRTLARQAGKTVPHEALLEQVWGPAYQREVGFIWVYIRRLRQKIEPDPARPRYIQTAPGVGYLLAIPAPERAGAQ